MPFDLSNISDTSLIFGGLTLISLTLAWVYYKTVTNHGKHWQHTIDRNTDAFIKNAEVQQAMRDVIHELAEAVRELLKK